MTLELDGKVVKFQIWDTAGQERFRSIIGSYYRSAKGILMVYDCSSPSSANNLSEVWAEQVKTFGRPSVPVLVVGNKSDLACNSEEAHVIAQDFADSKNYQHVLTSALTGEGVMEALVGLARYIRAEDFAPEGGHVGGGSAHLAPPSASGSFNCCSG